MDWRKVAEQMEEGIEAREEEKLKVGLNAVLSIDVKNVDPKNKKP